MTVTPIWGFKGLVSTFLLELELFEDGEQSCTVPECPDTARRMIDGEPFCLRDSPDSLHNPWEYNNVDYADR